MANIDLLGRRFGRLTVLEDSGQRKGNSVLWRCRCDCGGETLATRRQLVSGNVMSCGCVSKKPTSKTKAEDLTGRQFGELTALHRVENDKTGKICWLCRCSCGKELAVRAEHLKSGKTRSCGCRKYDKSYTKYDLTGQRFGRLTALYSVNRGDGEKRSYWHCRCDCGKELDVYIRNLLHGLTQSCGCWSREQSTKMHDHMHYQDNTCVEILRYSCSDTGRNKYGFRGMFLLRNGKYRVTITFQGMHTRIRGHVSFE